MKKQIWLFIILLPCCIYGQGIPLYMIENAPSADHVIQMASDSIGGAWVHKDSLGLQIDSVTTELDTINIYQGGNVYKIPNAIIYDYYIANNTGDFELRLALNGIVDGGPIQYLPSPPSTHQDGRSVLHMSTSPPAGITPSNYFEVSPNRFLYWKDQVHTSLNINGEFPYSDNVILFEINDPSNPSGSETKRIELDETLKADWDVFSVDTFFLRVDTNVIATQNDLSNINVNTDTALIRSIVSDSVIWSTNVDGDAYINEAVGIFNTDPLYPLQVGKNPALSAGSSIAVIGDGVNGMVIKESTSSNPYSAAFFGPVKFWNGSEGGGALINANDDAGTAGQVLTSQGEASTFTWETIDTNTVVGLGDFVTNNSSGGSADGVVSDMQLVGTDLTVTGLNGGFNGIVDLSSLAGGSSQWTALGNDIYNSNTGRVGVGTSTPATDFHVEGRVYIDPNNVATPNATRLLDIADNNTSTVRDNYPTLSIRNRSRWTGGSGGNASMCDIGFFADDGVLKGFFRADARGDYFDGAGFGIAGITNHDFFITTNNVGRLTIKNTGNIGIGTASPSAKLDVVGNAEINGNATITDSLNVIGSVRVHSSLYDGNNSKGSYGQIAFNAEIPGSSDGFIWEDQDQALVSTHYATLYDARDTLSNVGSTYRPIRFKDAVTIEHGNSFTVDVANDEIDIDKTGWYEVEYSISFTSDTDAEFTVAVLDASNNVICGLQQDYVNSSLSFGTMSSSNIANLLDTDVLSLEIKVTSGLVDIDDINATLKIRRIR